MLYWLAKNLVISGAKAISESRKKNQQRIADANYQKGIESIMARIENGATISEIRSQLDCSDPIVNSILTALEPKIKRPLEPQRATAPTQPTPHPPICPTPPPIAPARQAPPTHPPNRPITPPPLAVDRWDGNAFGCLRVGRKSQISFHRTLRIPEDGKCYPLPASLGVLPIHRVEDYADKVPQTWLEEGGFFIPLYQKEAMFIQFGGDEKCPSIAKVCVGRINAITGKSYSERLTSHSQDYLVIPKQQWLDGINSGDGTVKQFVAMPLGQGYTVEAQITDEEKHGGFQLVVYEPIDGRFSESDYSLESRIKLLHGYLESLFVDRISRKTRREKCVIQSIRDGALPTKAAFLAALDTDEAIKLYNEFRNKIKVAVERTAAQLFLGSSEEESQRSTIVESLLTEIGLRPIEAILAPAPHYAPAKVMLRSSPSPSLAVDEMSIAAGGRIHQQIFQDPYGVESWDVDRRRSLAIHMVNSVAYKAITGNDPPPSPISAEEYQKFGIPWFSHYDENWHTVKAAALFKNVVGVEAIDKRRGLAMAPPIPITRIAPELILRIKTPDLDEAIQDFRLRARASAAAGQWKAAIREMNYLIDLGGRIEASDYALRSSCNYYLKRFVEGAIDGEFALKIDSESFDALSWRARCRLALGDIEGAQEDVKRLTRISGSELTVLGLEAEISRLIGQSNNAL